MFALYLLAIIESLLVFQEIKRQAASYISKKSSDFLKCLKVNCEILCDRRQPGLTAKFKREREVGGGLGESQLTPGNMLLLTDRDRERELFRGLENRSYSTISLWTDTDTD